MKNNNFLFTQTARILNQDVTSEDVNFPANCDICITKIPIRKIDGYSDQFMEMFANKVFNSMGPNGMVFLVCYAPTECKYRPFEVAKKMTEVGFKHIDNIIVEKTWVFGRKIDNMLSNSHEYVLVFSKSDNWVIDKKSLEQFLGIEGDDFLGNTWIFDSGPLNQAIPIHLAEALMLMVQCLPGALIIDPFMSNTSTLLIALKLGYSFWGCEKDKTKMEKYEEIIKNYQREVGVYEFIRED